MSYSPSGVIGVVSVYNTSSGNVGGMTRLLSAVDVADEISELVVTSVAQFPKSGNLKINSEYFTYTGVTESPAKFTGVTRRAHSIGSEQAHFVGAKVCGAFVGRPERNFQPDVLVSFKSDQGGKLFFDFSDDNVEWDPFPLTGFKVFPGKHRFHKAVKGPRIFRVRFICSSSEKANHFRVHTYFGQYHLGTLPLNQPILSNADAMVVRSVATGARPDGTFRNKPMSGYVVYEKDVGKLPFDSGVLDLEGYTQMQREIFLDAPGLVTSTWYSDSLGANVVRHAEIPISASATGTFDLISSSGPLFSRYCRYKLTAREGATPTQTLFALRLLTQAVSGQVLGVQDLITSSMVCNLQRGVTVGQQPDGGFVNLPADGSAWSVSNLPRMAALTESITAAHLGNVAVDTIIAANWAEPSPDAYFVVGREVLQRDQNRLAATSLHVVGRGLFGTTPAAHDAGSVARQVVSSGWVDSDGWNTVELFINSNQPSMMRGVIIQFTDDARATPPVARRTLRYSFTQDNAASGSRIIAFRPMLDGFRVMFVPSNNAPTVFFMDVTLKTHRMQDSHAGPLQTSVQGSFLDRAMRKREILGHCTRFAVKNKMQDVCEFNMEDMGKRFELYTPDVEYGVELVSRQNADKAAGGDGVQRVGLVYLDTGWEERYIEIDLNGKSVVRPAQLASGVMRVNDLFAVRTGSLGFASGDIVVRVRNNDAQHILRCILAGQNKDLTALYTVPRGHAAYLDCITVTSAAFFDLDMRLQSNTVPHTRALNANVFLCHAIVHVGKQQASTKNLHALRFPEKADIKISVIPSNTNGDCSVCVSMTEVEME